MRNNCSKVIVENFFEPCVLYLLLQKASYGYELKNNLDENCRCNVNIGNLYRGLARLKRHGYVTQKKTISEKGPSRTTYSITASGKKYLKSWIDDFEIQVKIINKLIGNYKNFQKNH